MNLYSFIIENRLLISWKKGMVIIMPRTKEQFEQMRNEARNKIHSAALHVFAEKGMAAASMQDIAERAGISTGLIYRYYTSKKDMYCNIIDGVLGDLRGITEAFKSDAPPKLLMEQIFGALCSSLENNMGFSNMLVLMTHSFLSADDDRWMKSLLDEDLSMISAIEKLIERGQETGDFKEGSPREMASLVFSAMQGLGIMKAVLKESFAIPPISMILSFLMKSENPHTK